MKNIKCDSPPLNISNILSLLAQVYLYPLLLLGNNSFLVVITFLSNLLAKPDKADQIWNSHQTICSIGEIPYQIKSLSSTDVGHEGEDYTICNQNIMILYKILQGLLTIILPAKNS